MLGVQNEKYLQGFYEFRMRFEGFLVEFVQHVEEVLNITELLRGKVEVSTDSVTI